MELYSGSYMALFTNLEFVKSFTPVRFQISQLPEKTGKLRQFYIFLLKHQLTLAWSRQISKVG